MSKIVDTNITRNLSDYVQTADGALYCVDSSYTLDNGFETMVFKAEKLENGWDISWVDLYVEWHNTYEEMKVRHEEIINNLEDYLP